MRKWVVLGLIVAAVALPDLAHAASGGGGGMPWDQAFTRIKDDLTGPVAFAISLIAFAVCGFTFAFAHEIGPFTRTLLIVIMVSSMLAGIVQVAAALGIAGATIT